MPDYDDPRNRAVDRVPRRGNHDTRYGMVRGLVVAPGSRNWQGGIAAIHREPSPKGALDYGLAASSVEHSVRIRCLAFMVVLPWRRQSIDAL